MYHTDLANNWFIGVSNPEYFERLYYLPEGLHFLFMLQKWDLKILIIQASLMYLIAGSQVKTSILELQQFSKVCMCVYTHIHVYMNKNYIVLRHT